MLEIVEVRKWTRVDDTVEVEKCTCVFVDVTVAECVWVLIAIEVRVIKVGIIVVLVWNVVAVTTSLTVEV